MSRPTDSWDDTPNRSIGGCNDAGGRFTGASSTGGPMQFASGSGATVKVQQAKAKKPVVRDDWDADDDDEDIEAESTTPAAVEEQNKRIWEDANTKPHHPMPKVIMSRGASGSSAPPAIASTNSLPLNQPPPMRILKRPSAVPAQVKQTASPGESFQEREARYQAARERIFGTASPDASASGASTPGSGKGSKKAQGGSGSASPSPGPAATKVLRDPKGPPNSASDGRGFGERRPQRPSNSPSISTPRDSPSSTGA